MFPSDKHFTDEFIIQDIYNKKICRFILCKLETWNSHKIISLSDLSVEHIYPQKPKPTEWSELPKELLHSIGNLTLTHWADNSSLSNKPFTEKLTIEQGYKQSALRLNEYVVEQAQWGERQINERAAKLAELAKKIWPYPYLSEDEIKSFQPESELEHKVEGYKYYNPYTKTLFEILDGKIRNLNTAINRVFNNEYIAYKFDTNFADVELQKSRLHIWINMRFGEIADPKGICRDVSGVGHLGNGDVELYYDFNTPIDDVMAIIEQAFRQQCIE
jgi:predicted transport protein